MAISVKYIYLGPAAAAAAKSLQSCPTLCDPIDSSSPDCPVPGSLEARTLEWVAISFSKACKWKVKVKSLSRVQLTRLLHPWDFPGKSPGVGCHCLLQSWGYPTPYTKTISKAVLEDLKVKISHIWSRLLCEGLCSLKIHVEVIFFFLSFHFFFKLFLILLYNIVLVLPYIDLNLP